VSTPPLLKILAGLGAVSAISAAALWINLGGDDYPTKGQCVQQTGTHTLTVVACTSAAARAGGSASYAVLARFTGVDTNQCDEVPGTARAFVEYPSDQAPIVLCAGPVQ
jgi:hypothetical protein